jgi:hypothetical protein
MQVSRTFAPPLPPKYSPVVVFQGEGLALFTSAHDKYGLHIEEDQSVTGLEWAPDAEALALVGDFSESPVLSYRGIDARGGVMHKVPIH